MSESFENNFELLQHVERPTPLHRFPLDAPTVVNTSSQRTSFSESSTVEDLISDVSPSLALRPVHVQTLTAQNLQRISDYDNVSGGPGSRNRRTVASSVGTTYCTPWDSSAWHQLIERHPQPDLVIGHHTAADDDKFSSASAFTESGCTSECATSTFGSQHNRTKTVTANEDTPLQLINAPVIDDIDDIVKKAEAVSDDEGMEDDHDLSNLGNNNNKSGLTVRHYICE